ncbi:MAG TPA: tetratricopeptide repeat protein, partial [Candidatus Tripitaka sp. YC43]
MEALINKGKIFIKLGRYEDALVVFKKASELSINSYEVWYNMAGALFYAGKLEDSSEAVERAIVLWPDSPEAWSLKGLILSALGKDGEAIGAYTKALNLRPGHAAT